MSGVGRGRGAVLPAWMKDKGFTPAAAPGSAPGSAPAPTPASQSLPVSTETVGSKRPFDAAASNERAPNYHTRTLASNYASRPPSHLPPGWEAAFDPTYQRTYYFNRSTGERTWTLPTPAPLAAAAAAAAAIPKPQGKWEASIDPSSNREYYFNRATGERTWILPAGVSLEGIGMPERAVATAAGGDKKLTITNAEETKGAEQPGGEEATEEGEVGTIPHAGGNSDIGTTPNKEYSPEAEAAPPSSRDASVNWKRQRADNDGVSKSISHHGDSTGDSHPAAPDAFPGNLPPGWATAVDSTSGRTYYYNTALAITQWTPPAMTATTTVAVPLQSTRPTPTAAAAAVAGVAPSTATGPQSDRVGRRNRPDGGAVDPMDPSSYSDAPPGGWGAGLGKNVD